MGISSQRNARKYLHVSAASSTDSRSYSISIKARSSRGAIEYSRNGMIAARMAALPLAIVRSKFFGDERFGEAAIVVNELSELLDVLVASTRVVRTA